MTPNFISSVNTSVALSCTCRGSGNLQEECEQLQRSFSRNPCLGACIQGRGRGSVARWLRPSSDRAAPSLSRAFFCLGPLSAPSPWTAVYPVRLRDTLLLRHLPQIVPLFLPWEA